MKQRNIKLIALLIWVGGGVSADVNLPHLFSDNMMFQRNQPIRVWGQADTNEAVRVGFNGAFGTAKADASGAWQVELPPMEAGGPFELTVTGKNTLKFSNILIGDIWVCSGQSNMEWPLAVANHPEEEVENATHPRIRIFSIKNTMATMPQGDVSEGGWKECTPDSIPNFSAVGYFFGRFLHRELNVPVGLVGASWGGTVAETWISAEGLADDPDFASSAQAVADVDLEETMSSGSAEFAKWRAGVRSTDEGIVDGEYRWSAPDVDRQAWECCVLPGLWEQSGRTDLAHHIGSVWFARNVVLSEAQATCGAWLSLGPIIDSDMAWVNGVKVGETEREYETYRKYPIPPECLNPGANQIVVRVANYGGYGGLWGMDRHLFLQAGTERVPLAGDWKYRVGMKLQTPNPIKELGPNAFPTLLYNGMIAPLVKFPIKGAIWYQGESNAGRAYQYRELFKRLIVDWRNQWGIGDFPFLFVQLANFTPPDPEPVDSEWAELREAQDMALALPNTGMASAIDIGVADDIHPRNKQEVGRRLGLQALQVAYGQKDLAATGPRFQALEFKDGAAFVTFSETGLGLEMKGAELKGFTMAGADRSFHWAKAELVDATTVKIFSNTVVKPIAVRYAWANNPDQANLYNRAGLPTNPFRTDDWNGATFGRK